MNRIRVSNSEMLNILQYNLMKENAPDILQHIYDNGFIFNEFALIWENTYTYKVRIDGTGKDQIIYVKKIYETVSGKHEHINIEFTLEDYLENMSEFFTEYTNTKKYSKKMIDNTWSADYVPVVSFMHYVIDKSLNQEIIYKDKAERHYKSSGKAATTNKEYKLIDVIRRYSEHINHSKHHITCEHWIVKGHFRHYRNGKTTYIKPYSKGKNKDAAPVSRDYKL